MIIAKHLSSRQVTLPRRLWSQLTFVYMCVYVAVVSHAQQCHVQECNYWLKLKHVHPGFWHVSFRLAAWVLSRSMVLFATRNLVGSRLWFSTLKINGWTCVAIRAFRARAATYGAEQWALNMFIPQLHTLQVTKIWSGRINEARVWVIRAISAGNARAATVEPNSECGWHVPHSHLYTCKHLSGRTYTCGVHEAWLGHAFLVILLQVDCGHVMLWLGRYKRVLLWTWQQSLSWHSECWFLLLWKLPFYKVGCHNNTQWHYSSLTSFPGHGMEFGKHSHTGSQVWEQAPDSGAKRCKLWRYFRDGDLTRDVYLAWRCDINVWSSHMFIAMATQSTWWK